MVLRVGPDAKKSLFPILKIFDKKDEEGGYFQEITCL